MSTTIFLPKLAVSMQEGELSEWLVADGASVAAGDPILSVEADKSTMEIEAPIGGTLRHVGKAGETYPVGTAIAIIE